MLVKVIFTLSVILLVGLAPAYADIWDEEYFEDADAPFSWINGDGTQLDTWSSSSNAYPPPNWIRDEGTTASGGTGPSTSTGSNGFYAYTESSAPAGTDAEYFLEYDGTPLDADINKFSIDFIYHIRGSNVGTMYLEVNQDLGSGYAGWIPVWDSGTPLPGGAGLPDAWHTANVDLDALGYSTGTLDLRFKVELPGSGILWQNDFLVDEIVISNEIRPLVVEDFEDFESIPSIKWISNSGDVPPDWSRQIFATLSGGTGPSQGDTSGYYMYTEASTPTTHHDEFILEYSDVLDSTEKVYTVGFNYHIRGSNMGTLSLQVDQDTGSGFDDNWDTLWSHQPPGGVGYGDVWKYQNVDLKALGFDSGMLKLRFSWVMPSSGAPTYLNDVAIDNILIQSEIPGAGESTTFILNTNTVSSSAIDLDWQPAPDLNVIGYQIERKLSTDPDFIVIVPDTGNTNTEYLDGVPSLRSSTEYVYRVTAIVDASGTLGSESNESSETTDLAPVINTEYRILNCGGSLSLDPDGDALCNEWEDDDGLRIGTLGEIPGLTGEYFYPCGGEVTCPSRTLQDIYVEIDYMEDHRPDQGALDDVVAVFLENGINLHLQVDEEIPFQHLIDVPGTGNILDSPQVDGFYGLKRDFFGTVDERTFDAVTNPTPEASLVAKRQAFHYAVFIHQQTADPSSSGWAEVKGNDFVVSLGSFGESGSQNEGVGSPDDQRGTFMHELGHNLGFFHGGVFPIDLDEDGTISLSEKAADNCKPNYLSVMNYAFQFSTLIERPLDFSHSAMDTLDETMLVDDDGIGDSNPLGMETVFGHPDGSHTIHLSGHPVDWDSNPSTATATSHNVNKVNDVPGCFSDEITELVGHDDWDNIYYNFRQSGDLFDTGASSGVQTLSKNTPKTQWIFDGPSEMTREDVLAMRDIAFTSYKKAILDSEFQETLNQKSLKKQTIPSKLDLIEKQVRTDLSAALASMTILNDDVKSIAPFTSETVDRVRLNTLLRNTWALALEPADTVLKDHPQDSQWRNVVTSEIVIPDWVRNNAGWWSEGLIGDNDFTSGLEYLIQNDIIQIPSVKPGEDVSKGIPEWIRNIAGWWSDKAISDDEFVSAIEYLIKNSIIRV